MNTEISGSLELLELAGDTDLLQQERFDLKSFAKQGEVHPHNPVEEGGVHGRA